MKKEFELVFGSHLPFKPNVVDRITIDETQSRINKLMGISDADFKKYVSKELSSESETDVVDQATIDETQSRINKLMGISDADFLIWDKGH